MEVIIIIIITLHTAHRSVYFLQKEALISLTQTHRPQTARTSIPLIILFGSSTTACLLSLKIIV